MRVKVNFPQCMKKGKLSAMQFCNSTSRNFCVKIVAWQQNFRISTAACFCYPDFFEIIS